MVKSFVVWIIAFLWAVTSILLGYQWWTAHTDLNYSEKVRHEAEGNLETCRFNNSTYKATIDLQSRSIADAKAEGDRRAIAASQAASQAQAVADARAGEIKRLQARISSPAEVSSCSTVIQELKGTLQ